MSTAVTKSDAWIPLEGGVSAHAWVFRPSGVNGQVPVITMAHGFAGTKYRALEQYARHFAERGFGVVIHDHRNFGGTGGLVPGDIDPWQQIADWRRVISFVEALEWGDSSRIGIWGTSFAGGHALVLGATDSRIKAVVSQVPTISGYEQSLRRLNAEQRAAIAREFDDDEARQLRGEPPLRQLLNSLDPSVRAAYRSPDIPRFYEAFPLPEGIEPSTYITLRSTRRASMYEPGAWIDRMQSTALLMIIGTGDTTTPADLALAAFERAAEPKKVVTFDGGHYDAYMKDFPQTSQAAADWFEQHLL